MGYNANLYWRNNMNRVKFFVEYPIATTINQCIEWMKRGGDVWQEISDEFPECMGFDDIECLKENFPETDFEEGYDADIQSYYLHLVPADYENDAPAPFRVGERAWATKRHISEDGSWETSLIEGTCWKIVEINEDGNIRIDNKYWADKWFDADEFARVALPVNVEKVFILNELGETNFFGACESSVVYEKLDTLKMECTGVVWSDEYEDFEDELHRLGIDGNYGGSNWDIEGVDIKTGELYYGVIVSEKRVEFA
jgi:hypothetical protein